MGLNIWIEEYAAGDAMAFCAIWDGDQVGERCHVWIDRNGQADDVIHVNRDLPNGGRKYTTRDLTAVKNAAAREALEAANTAQARAAAKVARAVARMAEEVDRERKAEAVEVAELMRLAEKYHFDLVKREA